MNAQTSRGDVDAQITLALERLAAQLRELQPTRAQAAAAAGTPAPDASAPDAEGLVGPALDAARRKAAVLSWFKPQRLVDLSDRRLRERVLSDLVMESDVDPSNGLWRLRMEPRREILASLAQGSGTSRQLLRETKSEATDSQAHLLRQVLRGKTLNAERVPHDQAQSMLQVAEWTDGILKNAPRPADVRGLLARRALKQSLGVLLQRFRGRKSELETLDRFVAARLGLRGALPIFAVSGIGGVGKSTLLARFAEGLLERPPRNRPAVVLIDFDRARFSSGDPTALTFELTRQIAAWFPSIAGPLRKLRQYARLNLLSSRSANTRQLETSGGDAAARSASETSSLLPGILERANIGGASGRPLVIILDTFEVLQGLREDRSPDGSQPDPTTSYRGVDAILRWAEELFLERPRLKLVLAGRAPITEDPNFGPRLTEPEMVLRGLDTPTAEALLVDQGMSAADARLIAQAVGDPADGSCNPLILRLAGRLVKTGSLRPAALKKERLGDREVLDQELVQGMLYRRILAHIGDREKDKALAALAHPGLVLRRVTPDLILRVLIPHTGLEKEKLDSRELFNRLRREVWLVRDVGEDTVLHRTDLRRTMLRLIDADMRAQAQQIHRAAIRYYERGEDPRLTTELAAAEAFYHRLMLIDQAQAARLDPAEVRRFESSLSFNMEDLSPPVRAVVKSILDRPLTDEDARNLPEPQRSEFILRQGERYLQDDDPYRALRLLEAKPKLHPLWELRALAHTAMWHEAKTRGLLTPPPPSSVREAMTPGEVHERVDLATRISFYLNDGHNALACAERLLAWFDGRKDWAQFPATLLEMLARIISYATVAARELRSPPPLQRIPWRSLSHEYLSATSMALEATRQVVLGVVDKNWKNTAVLSGEALPPSLRLLEYLAESCQAPSTLKAQLIDIRRQLKALPRKAPSGRILGVLARGLPRAVIDAPPPDSVTSFRRWLPSPSPEFRGPVKFALLEAFTTSNELEAMAEVAWDLFELRPYDLRPKTIALNAARPGGAGPAIAILVHYLDRSGVLWPFLQSVRKLKPKAAKLSLVTAAFQRWERAFEANSKRMPRGR